MTRLLWLVLLTSCMGSTSQPEAAPPSTVDSQVLRSPDVQPIDTDDYNKPSNERIPLDSPVGPNPGWDTVLAHPVPGRP